MQHQSIISKVSICDEPCALEINTPTDDDDDAALCYITSRLLINQKLCSLLPLLTPLRCRARYDNDDRRRMAEKCSPGIQIGTDRAKRMSGINTSMVACCCGSFPSTLPSMRIKQSSLLNGTYLGLGLQHAWKILLHSYYGLKVCY